MIMVMTCSGLALSQIYPVQAKSFEGREQEMNEKCSAIYDEETQQECADYIDYLNNRSSELESNVEDLKNQIASVNGNIDAMIEKINQNNKELKKADEDLTSIESSISSIEASIGQLATQIKEKEVTTKKRDEQMKERLIEMQPYIGSNNFIDFLMGASSFTDLLRRTAVVGELNSYERDQIEALSKEKKALNEKQEEVKTKQNLLVAQQKEIKVKQARIKAYQDANEDLLAQYQKQEAGLAEQKRKAQVESGQFASSIPTIDLSIIPKDWGSGSDTNNSDKENNNEGNEPSNGTDNGTDNGNQGGDSAGDDNHEGNSGSSGNNTGGSGPALSDGFITPIQGNFYRSAGTWAYPDGGEHLGRDFGTYNQVGLPVVAPASGIIVAINDGVPNHGVYESGLNSWTGYPSGGGNTLHMIVNVKGTSYGISFYHLSPGMFNVSVGSIVSQGQLIAHTGHSGNSSGPHCHVEVTNLGKVSIDKAVQIFYSYGKDYFYGNYNANGQCAIKGSTPCLERPENFFG